MSTIVQMFAFEDGHLAGGYSTQNFMETMNNIRLLMLCVEICLRNIACMSVFYNTVTRACRLHSNVFYNSDFFVSETGWHYYRAVGDPKCDVYNGFVHQRDAGLCYRAESDLLTKTLSDSACSARNSTLAILNSEKKQNVVVGTLSLMSRESFVGFYIGATLNTGNSQWYWRDATLLVYNAFDAADDKLVSETCVLMVADVSYKWYSEACTYTAGYVCEVDL
ncbi:C-type lectin domain family 4 member E-like [Ylistrum balloti]|uniref:C-type lectin domain family 4 member E-like n=1 Tax=Ylistrum balloti TaxID=509963 RepID=UPI002905DA88|nr:C-type lectin domain family 4 member E-like [Ylistrum balloti]